MPDVGTVKVLIVDANKQERTMMSYVLKKEDSFFIREAEDGEGGIQAFNAERPDAVLLDLNLPDKSGLETMQEMIHIDPTVPVIILTTQRDISTAVEAVKCGADDVIEKPPNLKRLSLTVKQVIAAPNRYRANALAEGYETLTPREREILIWTAEGYSCTKIAERLSISHRTVETHRENIFHKLGMKNKAELIRFAVIHGIIPSEAR